MSDYKDLYYNFKPPAENSSGWYVQSKDLHYIKELGSREYIYLTAYIECASDMEDRIPTEDFYFATEEDAFKALDKYHEKHFGVSKCPQRTERVGLPFPLDSYLKLQEEIFDYFGYKEDWVVIPIDDAREYIWQLNGSYDENGKVIGGDVIYAKKLEDFDGGDWYGNDIYTQRFLPKWVYRGEDYTMIVVDTHVDGNKFLQIFDNSKELKGDDRVPQSGSLF